MKFFKSNRQIQLSDLKAASDGMLLQIISYLSQSINISSEFPLQLKPYEWNRMNNSNDLTPLQDQGFIRYLIPISQRLTDFVNQTCVTFNLFM